MGFSPKISVVSVGGGVPPEFTLKLFSRDDPTQQWRTNTCTGQDSCTKPTTCLKDGYALGNSDDKVVCAEIACTGSGDCKLDYSITWDQVDVKALAKLLFEMKLCFFMFVVVMCCTVPLCVRSYRRDQDGKGKGTGKGTNEFGAAGDESIVLQQGDGQAHQADGTVTCFMREQ